MFSYVRDFFHPSEVGFPLSMFLLRGIICSSGGAHTDTSKWSGVHLMFPLSMPVARSRGYVSNVLIFLSYFYRYDIKG